MSGAQYINIRRKPITERQQRERETYMKKFAILAVALFLAPMTVQAQEVRISPDLLSITVDTEDGKVEIIRNQNQENLINPAFAKTSRKCPPFCIQPNSPAPGVHTVGELEVIQWLRDKKGPLIDGRTIEWHVRGTIPGAKNIPFTQTADRLNELGCKKAGGKWDCSGAVEVMMFCNGPWCGQSPTAIKAMVREGYPADKIYYFRNGMQGWEIHGLTVVEGQM